MGDEQLRQCVRRALRASGGRIEMKRISFGLALGVLALAALSLGSGVQAATPCADLLVESVASVPAPPAIGQPSTVAITVRNAGTCAAGGFGVQWRPDLLATPQPTIPVAGLDAGATTVVNVPYTFARTGIFLSFATVDVANAVAETNEGNNVVPKAFTPSLGVDLVVSDVSIDPATPAPGQPFTVSVTVANQGPNPAGAFRVDWSPGFGLPTIQRQVAGARRGRVDDRDDPLRLSQPRHLRQPRELRTRKQRPGDERVQQREVVQGDRDGDPARPRGHGRVYRPARSLRQQRRDGDRHRPQRRRRGCGELRRALAAVAARRPGHDADRRPRARRVGDRQPELRLHLSRDVRRNGDGRQRKRGFRAQRGKQHTRNASSPSPLRTWGRGRSRPVASATTRTATRGRWSGSRASSTSAPPGACTASRPRRSTSTTPARATTTATWTGCPRRTAPSTRTTWTCGPRSGSTRRRQGCGSASTSRP